MGTGLAQAGATGGRRGESSRRQGGIGGGGGGVGERRQGGTGGRGVRERRQGGVGGLVRERAAGVRERAPRMVELAARVRTYVQCQIIENDIVM